MVIREHIKKYASVFAALACAGAISFGAAILTRAAAPVAVTDPATDITQTTAVLHGHVLSTGSLDVIKEFAYGPTTSYGTTTAVSSGVFVGTFGISGFGGPGEFFNLYSVGTDSAGNVYTTDRVDGRIQKFDADGTFLIAFSESGSDPGQINAPDVIVQGPDGYLYVADTQNDRIQRFTTEGVFFDVFLSISQPTGIAFDSTGNMFVSSLGDDTVSKFSSGGVLQGTIGLGIGTNPGEIQNPYTLAIDSSDNLYISLGALRVDRFNSAGTYMDTVGTSGTGEGQFGAIPVGIALDDDDNLFVADTDNNRIQKFDENLSFLYQYGTMGSGDDQLIQPYSIALGNDGDIYIADSGNSRIVHLNDAFSLALSGLSCGSTYHYEARLSNSDDSDGGGDVSFTTDDCPSSGGGGGGSSGTHFICTDPLALNYTAPSEEGKPKNSICRYPEKDTLACSTPIYLERPVKYGASNIPDDVRLLQKFLNTYENRTLTVDGFYGPDDYAAVKAWQEKYASYILKPWKLAHATGYVYVTSLNKIKEIHTAECLAQGLSVPADRCYIFDRKLVRGSKSNFVRAAQTALRADGSLTGAADGVFGKKTEAAVMLFQAKHNLRVDGIIDVVTGKELSGVACKL